MTSPVDTSVKHFYSSMQGGPVLAGQAGSLIALLDACLVTGWGLKAVDSAVIANGVCRMNFASGKSGGEVDAVILVAGASLAGLNGEQRITEVSSTWVEFRTALPDGAVTGSISFKMAAAGWSKPFSGTHIAVYQSPNPQSTRMFVRVDDTGTVEARLRGYETMTDASTGAGLFPLDGQINGGGYFNKSTAASATPVKWRIVANDRSVFINVVGYSGSIASAESGRTVFIGDFQGGKPGGDPYAFSIGCGSAAGYSVTPGTCDQSGGVNQLAPRSYTALGGAISLTAVPEIGTAGAISGLDTAFGPFPNVIDGGLRLSRRLMLEGVAQRGVVPGLYTVPQSAVGAIIAPLARTPGRGVLSGRNLLAIGCGAGSQLYPSISLGISFIDITGPWDY
ncbi:hypothetical protein [Comamonas suwonensis]|uniref:Uncharacterized protein n=1 Tax=Comamonas suwonensis TaxID=2606214 RepID=A0A843BGS0_9BURK|nr:hypothetical protein [Comamonas suwonensis]MBI1626758.1 hypothetical protein [Comamonas suwonensis]